MTTSSDRSSKYLYVAIPARYKELELRDLNVKPCKRKSSAWFTSGQQSCPFRPIKVYCITGIDIYSCTV